MGWLAVAGLAVVVLVAAALLGHLDRAFAALGALWRRVHPAPPKPDTVPVERLAEDLRRLATLLEQTYSTEQPSKMERLAAASLAYDWVLISACRMLEVPSPPMPPLDPMDRLQTEAALAREGLTW